jgi:hypothetical protein
MGFVANVLKVMIASPGDVGAERTAVTEEIHRWNNANCVLRVLLLHPVRWETHSSPAMGAHPQHLIDEQLLIDADIVVGIFGIRIGTPTPDFPSGSVEEIKKHVAAGKLAMLYFSRVPVDPGSVDLEQLSAVNAFKEECKSLGLFWEFESVESLRSNFHQHLTIELNKPQYVWLPKPATAIEPQHPELTDDEKSLLFAASADSGGGVFAISHMGGFSVQSNGKNFAENGPRSEAEWRAHLDRLTVIGYLEKRGKEYYKLTNDGFLRVDEEQRKIPFRLSVTLEGPESRPTLSLVSDRPAILKKIDFLTSSLSCIATATMEVAVGTQTKIPIDHTKLVELFNSPRPDKTPSDFSGPAALRLSFKAGEDDLEFVLPITISQVISQDTCWVKATGFQEFVARP